MVTPTKKRYIHVLIHTTCEYYLIRLKSKYYIAKDVIKVRILRGGTYIGISFWAVEIITGVLIGSK